MAGKISEKAGHLMIGITMPRFDPALAEDILNALVTIRIYHVADRGGVA
jgi:hypothetical protein